MWCGPEPDWIVCRIGLSGKDALEELEVPPPPYMDPLSNGRGLRSKLRYSMPGSLWALAREDFAVCRLAWISQDFSKRGLFR